jgi:methyl-accepting chemotaxis protein
MDAERNAVFNFFNNLRITHKLTLMMTVFLLGMVVIGASYFYQQVQMNEVDATESNALKMEFVDASTTRDILTAQNALTEFLLLQDEAYIQRYADAVENAKVHLDELAELATHEEDLQLIQQVREEIDAYQVIGDELLTLQLQIGLNENSGLRGASRQTIHKLESIIQEGRLALENTLTSRYRFKPTMFIPAHLEISMLTMRRHEKDLIERGDAKYVGRLNQEIETFTNLLQQSAFSAETKEEMGELVNFYQERFEKLATAVTSREQLLVKLDELQAQMNAQLQELGRHIEEIFEQAAERGEALTTQVNALLIIVMTTVATLAVLVSVLFAGSIRSSMNRLRQKVLGMADGDTSVAELLDQGEEFSSLGFSFDALLELRKAEADKLEQENEQINNSVIELMDAADRLSKRDLTVVVPVSEDITGNVSDALNLMTRETARIMLDINQLAVQLEAAAGVVRQQGDKVADVAANERQVVAQALAKLEESATTMAEMAELGVSCGELGGNAAQSTKQALFSVRNTVRNIIEIRNSVGETEKSIKRLGERSQEIGGIVEIIKDISERTHTLALNAGMQAVAAGEAGRGFSVVADEVQRLAETARESTDQIAALVQSIQAEASETMTIMNKTVSQVVEGSELAEKAGKRMRRTQLTTQDLVAAVEQMAERSKSQVSINEDLRASAGELEHSTEATEQELREQTTQTENLFKYLSALVKSVRVFKLPDAA